MTSVTSTRLTSNGTQRFTHSMHPRSLTFVAGVIIPGVADFFYNKKKPPLSTGISGFSPYLQKTSSVNRPMLKATLEKK